jgi:hypothetical protein
MTHFNIFDGPHLIINLDKAIARNCREMRRPDGSCSLRFGIVSGITVRPGPRTMILLPEQLSSLTYGDESATPGSLARLMAEVAILASYADVEVGGPLGSEPQLAQLKRKITTDFALNCALTLAQARGYPVLPSEWLWVVLHSVLLVNDDDWLRWIFRELLAEARTGARAGNTRQFPRGPGRTLSKESYWNLVSEAERAGWDDEIVLRLIEEYLSPPPSAHLVRYGNTVSGAEWKELHDSIFR